MCVRVYMYIQVGRQNTKYWIPDNLWCFWQWNIPASGTVLMDQSRYENAYYMYPQPDILSTVGKVKAITWTSQALQGYLKQNLKTREISPNKINSASLARASLWSHCQDAIYNFEATHVGTIQAMVFRTIVECHSVGKLTLQRYSAGGFCTLIGFRFLDAYN